MDGMDTNNKLTREQKVGVTLLFIFTLLTVGLAFLQMRNTLFTPFVLNPTDVVDTQKSLQDLQVDLQKIDTDKDGLNDFEEQEYYATSRYLPDTDSDGVSDKVEIDAGTNPLCVEGKFCEFGQANPQAVSTTQAITALPVGSTALSPVAGIAQDQETAAAQLQALINDPEQIRQMLRQTGSIPEEQLKKLDNATLISLLKQIISQQGQPQTPPVPDASGVSTSTKNSVTTTSTSQFETEP